MLANCDGFEFLGKPIQKSAEIYVSDFHTPDPPPPFFKGIFGGFVSKITKMKQQHRNHIKSQHLSVFQSFFAQIRSNVQYAKMSVFVRNFEFLQVAKNQQISSIFVCSKINFQLKFS